MNITLSMPTQYTDRLKQESKETGLNYSEIVRRALDLYYKERVRNELDMYFKAKE